jgi:hypothetical protein
MTTSRAPRRVASSPTTTLARPSTMAASTVSDGHAERSACAPRSSRSLARS